MAPTLWRRALAIGLPVALQTFLQALLGMADVAMVAGLGPAAVAAIGLAAKLHFLLLVLMVGVSNACGVLVAQYTGAGDQAGSRRTLVEAQLAGTFVALPLAAGFAGAAGWLGWLNPDPEVVALAARYLLITAPAVLLLQWLLAFEASLRSQGNTWLPLTATALAAVLNIIFNYAFIFGRLGAPELGAEGAAWGTLLARMAQLAVMAGWLYGTRHVLAVTPRAARELWQRENFRRFLWFSLPLILNHLSWGIGNATYHVATGFAGTEALAVMGIMMPLESGFFALFVGLASATGVLIGQALGAGDNPGAWRLYRFFDRTTLVAVLGLAGMLYLLRHQVSALLPAAKGQPLELLTDTVAVFCVVVWVKVLNMLRILGVLRAGGDNRFCLITDTIVTWCFGLPIYLCAVWLGAPFLVIYALTALEDGLKFLPVWRRLRQRRWLNNLTAARA